jgi:hypothetical protein
VEGNVSLLAVPLMSCSWRIRFSNGDIFILPSFCHFVSFEWEVMVVDSLLGTFTSGGEGVEKCSSGLFRILSLRSVFVTVSIKEIM